MKTKQSRYRFEDIDTCCNSCGRVETLQHEILICHEVADSDFEVQIKVGLHEEPTGRIIGETKRTIERWEKKARGTLKKNIPTERSLDQLKQKCPHGRGFESRSVSKSKWT